MAQPVVLPGIPEDSQNHFLQPSLQCGGNILVVLAERGDVVFAARAEHLDKSVGHPFVTLVIVCHPLGVDRDAIPAVVLDDVLEERIVASVLSRHDVVGVAKARQRHDDALVVDVLPPEIAGDGRIGQSQRMRIVVFLVDHLDGPATTDPQLHRLVVAHPVDAQQDRILKTAGEIGARQMRQMVVEET